MQHENGSIDIVLLIIAALLLSLTAISNEWLHSLGLLLRDHLHAEKATRQSVTTAVDSFQMGSLSSVINNLNCASAKNTTGHISQSYSFCALIPKIDNSPALVPNLSVLFQGATPCPRRSLTHLLSRSSYECNYSNPTLELPYVVNGDLIFSAPVAVLKNKELSLIGSRGSLVIEQISFESDLTLIALGDIQIHSLRNVSEAEVRVLIFAAGSSILIDSIQGSALIAPRAAKVTLPKTAQTIDWPETLPVSLLSLIPVGVFEQPLGIRP